MIQFPLLESVIKYLKSVGIKLLIYISPLCSVDYCVENLGNFE